MRFLAGTSYWLSLALTSPNRSLVRNLHLLNLNYHSSRTVSTTKMAATSEPWSADNPAHADQAKNELGIWPLDKWNAMTLNEVHPRTYAPPKQPHDVYDLIAIGAGAGGLVTSRQTARRGGKSAMISEHLAGGEYVQNRRIFLLCVLELYCVMPACQPASLLTSLSCIAASMLDAYHQRHSFELQKPLPK
jgi:hypothetical protein